MFKKIIRCACRILFLIAGVIEARVKPANIQINYFRATQTFGQKTNGICIPFPLQLQKSGSRKSLAGLPLAYF